MAACGKSAALFPASRWCWAPCTATPTLPKKTQTYTEIQALAEQYKQRNGGGSIVCRELLGLAKAEGSPVASPRTADYYKKRPCPELVRLAADIMAEYMETHPLPQD